MATELLDPRKNSDEALARYRAASDRLSRLSFELFPEGGGYGDPSAREAALHRLQSAKDEVERLYREYQDIDKGRIDSELLKLQRLSYWVAVAAMLAAVASTVTSVLQYLKNCN